MAFESPFARAFQSRFSRRFTCPDLQDEDAGGGLPTPPPPPPDVLLDIDLLSGLPLGSNFTRASAASFENAAGLIEFATADDVPVFEHRNGEPFGLVMERIEANNQSNSEAFTGDGWEAPTGLVLGTDPAHINPDGTVGGVQFTESGTATVHELPAEPFDSGNETAWTISVFVLPSADRRLIIDGEDAIGASALFDLTPGAGFVVSTSGVADDLDAEIRQVGNFYRIALTGTGNNTTTNGISFKFARPTHNTTADDIYDADPTISLFLWGAQRESREYPTSYIRNTSNGNVTRRDTRLNIPFDLPAGEFSFVFEWAVPYAFDDDKVTTQRMISFNQDSTTEDDSVELFLARFNQGLIAEKTVAGETSRTLGFSSEPAYPSGFIWRVALAVSVGAPVRGSYLGNDVDTNANPEWGLPFITAPNTLTIGRRVNSLTGATSDLYARRLKVYNRALTDAELVAESAL